MLIFQAKSVNAAAEFSEAIFNKALNAIDEQVINMCGRPLEQFGFPPLNREEDFTLDRDMLRETSYDQQELQRVIEECQPKLTGSQAAALERILASVNGESQDNFLFLEAMGVRQP